MPGNGWVKLYRDILSHWVYEDPEKLKIWITLLSKASHKEHKINVGYELVELQPGELVFGTRKFAEQVGLNQNKVYRTIKLFEDDGMIEYDTESYPGKFSIVRILNWEKYQTRSKQANQEVIGNDDTGAKRVTNGNENEQECKNVKNGKKDSNSNIARAYQENFGRIINPRQNEVLGSFVDDGMEKDTVIFGIKYCAEKGGNGFGYLKKVLNSWMSDGVRTVKDAQRAINRFEGSDNGGGSRKAELPGKSAKDQGESFSERIDRKALEAFEG